MKIDDEAARTKYNYCARLYHHGFGHVAICEVSACYFFRPDEVDERLDHFCVVQSRGLHFPASLAKQCS